MTMPETQFDKIAIIGLGLIGSSIAHAARRAHLAKEIAGHDASADVLERAGKIGFCNTLHADIGAAVKGAQAIILTNQKGAVLQLAGEQTGIIVSLDLSGLALGLK